MKFSPISLHSLYRMRQVKNTSELHFPHMNLINVPRVKYSISKAPTGELSLVISTHFEFCLMYIILYVWVEIKTFIFIIKCIIEYSKWSLSQTKCLLRKFSKTNWDTRSMKSAIATSLFYHISKNWNPRCSYYVKKLIHF